MKSCSGCGERRLSNGACCRDVISRLRKHTKHQSELLDSLLKERDRLAERLTARGFATERLTDPWVFAEDVSIAEEAFAEEAFAGEVGEVFTEK